MDLGGGAEVRPPRRHPDFPGWAPGATESSGCPRPRGVGRGATGPAPRRMHRLRRHEARTAPGASPADRALGHVLRAWVSGPHPTRRDSMPPPCAPGLHALTLGARASERYPRGRAPGPRRDKGTTETKGERRRPLLAAPRGGPRGSSAGRAFLTRRGPESEGPKVVGRVRTRAWGPPSRALRARCAGGKGRRRFGPLAPFEIHSGRTSGGLPPGGAPGPPTPARVRDASRTAPRPVEA